MQKNSTSSIAVMTYADVGFIIQGRYYLLGVNWTSNDSGNRDIAAEDDFYLTDANGVWIAGKHAEAADDGLLLMFSAPLPVDGLKLAALDGGICVLYLYTQ